MKCILCDRCNKVIEDPQKRRVVTCARPFYYQKDDSKKQYRGDDRQMNDIIWEKDLCADCITALEGFFAESDGSEGSASE